MTNENKLLRGVLQKLVALARTWRHSDGKCSVAEAGAAEADDGGQKGRYCFDRDP